MRKPHVVILADHGIIPRRFFHREPYGSNCFTVRQVSIRLSQTLTIFALGAQVGEMPTVIKRKNNMTQRFYQAPEMGIVILGDRCRRLIVHIATILMGILERLLSCWEIHGSCHSPEHAPEYNKSC